MAALDFESGDDLQAALGSPAGEKTLADLPNFAGAGVTVLTGPAKAV